MRPTGSYATYRGKEYRVVARGDSGDGFEYVGLGLTPDDDASQFDTVVDSMAKVAPIDLDRYEKVTTVGVVDGAEVTLLGRGLELEPVVACYTLAGPAWAKAHGFEGSQHDGWSGDVPLAEVSDIRTTVKDLLNRTPSGDRP